ncbi:MAG: transcription-repair coupling factor [Leptospiraceae bacterium]|nr:transcription-repair coupling factor [Leptospiraceae bacterium]MDW7975044.1 transcription-repair coupling factor [Leptospiraceae bacterium]
MLPEIFKKFFEYLQNEITAKKTNKVYALPQSGWSLLVASYYQNLVLGKKNNIDFIVFVLPESLLAKQLYYETQLFLPQDDLYLLPEFDGLPYEWTVHNLEIESHRIRTLHAIRNRKQGIIFTTLKALIQKIAPKSLWKNYGLELKLQQEIDVSQFLQTLIGFGYHREEKVENPGEFTIKGEIIDVFPIQLPNPVRIDLFDNEIESLRFFDSDTQRSIYSVERVEILPASEVLLNEQEFNQLKEKILSFPEDLRKPDWVLVEESRTLYNSRDLPGLLNLVGVSFPLQNFWEDLETHFFWIFAEEEKFNQQYERILREYEVFYEKYKTEKVVLEVEQILNTNFNIDQFEHTLKIYSLHNIDQKNHPFITQTFLQEANRFYGRITEFKHKLEELRKKQAKIYISYATSIQGDRISFILKNEQIPHKKVNGIENTEEIGLLESPLSHGFFLPSLDFYLFTDSDIFGKSYAKKYKISSKNLSPIESFLDLKEGDYVVHVTHGIGRFLRLERIKAAGRERDCLVIEYADEDLLYVPLDQISLVQRYLSPEEHPKLDHLGKASFKKVKEKVEKNIEEFARELLELYATRMQLKGHAFPPDTELQEIFESEFPYEETPDQIRAIEEVKRDMESERPMDRLICGDVGYGKTEVAIRAVFKCVEGGKQAAIICPTTILARQHFVNFRERFKNYPINIDWISSLRSNKENQHVKKALKEGKIDVIIGTHALLSNDVVIPNLGLLVIDEEQRFGVMHKEKLKKIKKTVDVLTLTATPIPRTLHMSLIGIRDLSIINTPPKERKPVITYVLEYSDEILKEAILRELDRGGQIFYLHNRIQTLPFIAEKIHQLVPNIRIALLHSKMDEKDKDVILSEFIDGKYDLLLTTTIIENGIDIPNVNTLIVDEADRFGLSQLYQIRGRVGRSHRQAYAYFFHKGKQTLTEEAQKRLNTLLEYQELGSGFKIAMRDLEIRGAGNILGKEQSGDIIQVGYEMYLKLLENAIRKLKGETIKPEFRCIVSFPFDFFISEKYVPNTRERIEFYKKFETCTSLQQFHDVVAELKDRFGEPDEVSKIFITLEEIRTIGTELGIESISEHKGEIEIKPSSYFQVPLEKMLKVIQSKDSFYLKPGNTQYIYIDTLRLRYLKEKKFNYKDVKIVMTQEDLKYLIEKLQMLLKIKNGEDVDSLVSQGKKTYKKQKTIAQL